MLILSKPAIILRKFSEKSTFFEKIPKKLKNWLVMSKNRYIILLIKKGGD
jgi:uncharacterized membrane protein